jgi:PleD family two-component response regulator
VSDTPIRLADGREVSATISVGAGLLPDDVDVDAIIASIDAALLDAKRHGRDRVALRA